MIKIISFLAILAISINNISSQEQNSNTELTASEEVKALQSAVKILKKFKVSGYVQGQFQYGEENATLRVGSKNGDKENSFNRIGVRRGRIKLSYEDGIASAVFQPDITEKGVSVKDVYLNVKDPWIKTTALRVGVFDRPFGYEISYSSSLRESPERSRVFNTLFPDERDLGGMIILQAKETSPWNFLKLEAGWFAGNGIEQETDNRMDFIGHVFANKKVNETLKFRLGGSYYNGGVYQGTDNVYTMSDNGFSLNEDESNKGKSAKREYIGFDGQISIANEWGLTQLRAEYLFGTQPGSKLSNKSPNTSTRPAHDTYMRNFNGAYLMLVQDLGKLPLSVVLKYDWYDPNTKVTRDDIGLNETSEADIKYNTFGAGMLWHITKYLRLQAYYEMVNNEKTDNLADFNSNRKDDAFTLRLQYKF